jgi:hypothetical protein
MRMKNDFLSRYGMFLLPICFLLSIFILFFYPVLFEGNTFFFRDIKHFAYPMKLYLAQVWAEGEWPYWYPYLFQGTPLMSLMHPGVFYPPSVLFLLNDFHFAFNAYFLFHHLLLMGSVYGLCRYWGRSIPASLAASLTALLGGYFLSLSAVYNHFHAAVWLPLMLLMWQKFMDEGRGKHFCGAVVILALQVLAGSPESAIFSVLLVYAHSLYLAKEDDRLQGFTRKSLAMLALVLLALALSALQWVPTYQLLQELKRGKGLAYVDGTAWSLPPSALLDLFLPEKFANLLEQDGGAMNYFLQSFYMGIMPLFFLLGGLLVGREQKEIRFWLMVFGVGVFFALGKYNSLYALFHEWVPVFSMFAYPQKFFFLCAYGLVFLSAFALDRFVQAIIHKKSEMKKLLFVLLAIAMVVAGMFGTHADRAGLESLMILLLLVIAIFALHLKKMNRVGFFSLLLLLMVMDLMGKNSMLIPMIDGKFYTEPPPLAKRLGGTADSFRTYYGSLLEKPEHKIASDKPAKVVPRPPELKAPFYNMLSIQLALRDELAPNVGAIYGIAYVEGAATMALKEGVYWSDSFLSFDPTKKKRILKRSNVKYWVTEDYEQAPSDQYPRGLKKVEVLEDVLPRAFLVGESGHVPYREKLLDVYYDARFNPLRQVLLTEPVGMKKAKNFSGQVQKIEYSPNRVSLKTNQNEEGFLVLLDTYFPGWKVEVDGKPEHIYRANYFYRGVRLGPGNHNIEFSYEPPGLKIGATISGVTALLLVLLFFMPTRKI